VFSKIKTLLLFIHVLVVYLTMLSLPKYYIPLKIRMIVEGEFEGVWKKAVVK
jgi:hypothetical protein